MWLLLQTKLKVMNSFRNQVYTILYHGCPLLVTPIGDAPVTTFLVDLEQVFILIEKQPDPDGVIYWSEYGKGLTSLSNEIGRIIEERERNMPALR